MIYFEIDTSSATPFYAQLMTQVRHALATGAIRVGDALPSIREMASYARINPLTVSRAYRELEQAGIVVSIQGRGTFVTAEAAAQGNDFRQEALTQALDQLINEAYRMGVTPEELRTALAARLQENTSTGGDGEHDA